MHTPASIAVATDGLDTQGDNVLAVALHGPCLSATYVKGGDVARTATVTRIPSSLYNQASKEPSQAFSVVKSDLETWGTDILLAYNAPFCSKFMQKLSVQAGQVDAQMPPYLDMLVISRVIINGQFFMHPCLTLEDLMKKLRQSPYDRKMSYGLKAVMETFKLEQAWGDRPAHEQTAFNISRLYDHLAGLECLRLI